MPKEKIEVDLSAAPDPEIEAGDTVNYVEPTTCKVTKTKVVSVPEEHKGRSVIIEVSTTAKNKDGDEVVTSQKVAVPYRPKEKLAGNTWHHAMIALLMALALSLQLSAFAAIPTYHTISAYGNNTLPATAIFPADPNSQIRVVTINYSSDNAAAVLNLSSGTTAYSLMYTNPTASWTTNVIMSTNGLSANAGLFLQHAGAVYTNTASSWANTGTNILTIAGVTISNSVTTYGVYGTGPAGFPATNLNYVITSFGWGVYPSVSDEIYLQGPITSISVGMGTNWLNGDDLFSGNYGRPVMAQITPATATNRLSSVSSHYDSASQP
jgi:hypothetical protein